MHVRIHCVRLLPALVVAVAIAGLAPAVALGVDTPSVPGVASVAAPSVSAPAVASAPASALPSTTAVSTTVSTSTSTAAATATGTVVATPARKPGKRQKPSKPRPSRTLLAVTLTQSQDTPSDGTNPFDPCTLEAIDLTGPIHQLFHVTLNDDGSTHVHIDSNYQGVKGVGVTSLRTYTTQDVIGEDVNILSPLPFVQDVHEMTHYIFPGNPGFLPDDFYLHFTFHVTVNATGTVTATPSNVEITCK